MARVTAIEIGEPSGRLQPTEVKARVKIFGGGTNGPVVQIDTFGSKDREFPDVYSQTLQFDRASGLKFLEILERAYRNR